MKVLFAVSNEEISESIVKKYQREYKEIISYKNVYYFNAILKELQKDKNYDRIVISEDLESFTHSQYDQIDKFIFEKLDSISDEASNSRGNDIPIILICSDRRTKSEPILVKLFGIGIYDAVIGNDRSINEVCKLIHQPRIKKEAKVYYKIDAEDVNYQAENENDVSEMEIQNIVAHYKRLGKNEEKYIDSFNNIAAQYNDTQLRIISKFLPLNVRAVLEEQSTKYQQVMSFNNSVSDSLRYQNKGQEKRGPTETLLKSTAKDNNITEPIVIPSSINMNETKKLAKKKPVENQQINRPLTQQPQQPQSYQQQVQQQQMKQSQIQESPVQQPKIQQPQVQQSQMQQSQVQQPQVQQPKIQQTPVQPVKPKPVQDIQEYNQVKPQVQQEIQNDAFDDILNNVSDIVNESIVGEKQEDSFATEPVKKRGRGRPRKNPLPEEDTEPKVKRKRGRPRKNPLPEETMQQPNISTTENDFTTLPGMDSFDDLEASNPTKQQSQNNFLPGLENNNLNVDNNVLPGLENDNLNVDNSVLPGLENDNLNVNNSILPGLEDNDLNANNDIFADLDDVLDANSNILPGLDDETVSKENNNSDFLPGFEDTMNTANNIQNNVQSQSNSYGQNGYYQTDMQNSYYTDMQTSYGQNDNTQDDMQTNLQSNNYNYEDISSNSQQNNYDSINMQPEIPQNNYYQENVQSSISQPQSSYNTNNTYESNIDIGSLLRPEQKIVTFVGTSKNGTSFMVNNIAELLSSMGVNTAILDTTKNRNSYYIYTKNEEELRKIATHSIEGLAQGVAQGISVNKNLTVYTSLPDEGNAIAQVDNILETLIKKHTLLLIDTDFDTPVGYFKQSQETYLVQTLDILTIQPLTAFLRELKSKNILDENKLKIILNKTVRVRGISDKTIIGGMAYYNDPAMSFMTELFDRNTIKYVAVPFEEEIYAKYLEGIIECDINLKGYSKTFMQTLRELGNMVYTASAGSNRSYQPPSAGNNGGSGFSNMNSTLEQMRRNY